MQERKQTRDRDKINRIDTKSTAGPASRDGTSSSPSSPSTLFDPAAQDHLFISYAWENCALADWLLRQLTLQGYRVWCDRFMMLGGESFPNIIDKAIKTRTFRLIALLSRHSLNKPNPRKERTLALGLSKEWGIDFMIPLNVDGLKASELPWDYSDLTYIPFENWASGLGQLSKLLVRSGAPRPLTAAQGREFAADTYLPQHVVVNQQEELFSNCFEFVRIPDRLYVIQTAPDTWNARDADSVVWPYYPTSDGRLVAFSQMPKNVPANRYTILNTVRWRDVDVVEGIRSRDIVSNLLRQAIERALVRRGLKRDPRNSLPFFPRGLIRKNRIVFTGRHNRVTRVSVVGQKTFHGKPYRYHLVADFMIRQDMGAEFVALLKVRVRLTDLYGKTFRPLARTARRKHLATSWFNHHWLSRVLGISSFLAKRKEQIVLLEKDDPVILYATPIRGTVQTAIDENALKDLRKEIAANTPGWEEEDEELQD